MFKKLLSLAAVALLTLSIAGSVMADPVKGKVTKVERDGRAVHVDSGGKVIELRISGSGTELEGVGDRGEIAVGMMVEGEYDPGDRNTASKLKVSK